MALSSGRGIAYVRVSTAEQVDSGLGLEAQVVTIRATAQRLNVELVATFDDAGISGALPLEQRPGLLAAIDSLRAGDALLCARRDRLGRDLVNVALIEKLVQRKHARIVSPDAPDDDSPASVLLKQLLDAFGQFERALIRQRTKSAMTAAKRQGRRVGHVPFGHRVSHDGRHLEVNPGEQEILQQIRLLRARGLALITICETLNEQGLRNRQGREWKPSFIGQLLDRHPAEVA
jgi:DNA invertase Pin-like site-specific DNA recombinase